MGGVAGQRIAEAAKKAVEAFLGEKVEARLVVVAMGSECECGASAVLVKNPQDLRDATELLGMSLGEYEKAMRSASPGAPS